jgi:hypothetical protein
MKHNAKNANVNSYVERRNALIPFAEKTADKALEDALRGMKDDHVKENGLWRSAVWNRAFHSDMNRMAHEQGLMVL